jgi:hypothetical protein
VHKVLKVSKAIRELQELLVRGDHRVYRVRLGLPLQSEATATGSSTALTPRAQAAVHKVLRAYRACRVREEQPDHRVRLEQPVRLGLPLQSDQTEIGSSTVSILINLVEGYRGHRAFKDLKELLGQQVHRDHREFKAQKGLREQPVQPEQLELPVRAAPKDQPDKTQRQRQTLRRKPTA